MLAWTCAAPPTHPPTHPPSTLPPTPGTRGHLWAGARQGGGLVERGGAPVRDALRRAALPVRARRAGRGGGCWVCSSTQRTSLPGLPPTPVPCRSLARSLCRAKSRNQLQKLILAGKFKLPCECGRSLRQGPPCPLAGARSVPLLLLLGSPYQPYPPSCPPPTCPPTLSLPQQRGSVPGEGSAAKGGTQAAGVWRERQRGRAQPPLLQASQLGQAGAPRGGALHSRALFEWRGGRVGRGGRAQLERGQDLEAASGRRVTES